jgi:uncharacterized repeat protein (TIGR02543 family)
VQWKRAEAKATSNAGNLPTTAPKPTVAPTPTPTPKPKVSLKLAFSYDGTEGGKSTQTSVTTGEDGVFESSVEVPTRTIYYTLVDGWDSSITSVNYTFLGYYNNNVQYFDGSGNPTGEKWSYAADETLYAVWSNESVTLDALVKEGYTFQGWSYDAAANKVYTGDTDIENPNEDETFYANYSGNTYHVTLVDEGSTTGSFNVVYGNDLAKVSIPEQKYTVKFTHTDFYANVENRPEDDYKDYSDIVVERQFTGYYTASGDKYFDSSGTGVKKWDIAEDTTLYARWEDSPITVANPESLYVAKTGYTWTFSGWSTTENGALITDISNYVVKSDVTFVANYIRQPVTVNFYDSSDENAKVTNTIKVQGGTTYPTIVVPTAPEIGYVLEGYYTGRNGLGTRCYNADGTGATTCDVVANGSVDLYPLWVLGTTTSETSYTIGLNETITITGDSTFTAVDYNENRLEVTGKGTTTLTVTGKKVSSSVIKVTKSDGAYEKITVKVKSAPTQINLNSGSDLYLVKGQYYRLTYKIKSSTASSSVTYKSTNKKVATVSAGGQIHAKKVGKCKIKVKTYNGTTAKVVVHVQKKGS